MTEHKHILQPTCPLCLALLVRLDKERRHARQFTRRMTFTPRRREA